MYFYPLVLTRDAFISLDSTASVQVTSPVSYYKRWYVDSLEIYLSYLPVFIKQRMFSLQPDDVFGLVATRLNFSNPVLS